MSESRSLPECAHFTPRSERVVTKFLKSHTGIYSEVSRCRSYMLGPPRSRGFPRQCNLAARRGSLFCRMHTEWESGECKTCIKTARAYRKAEDAAEREQVRRFARRSNLEADKQIELLRRTMRFHYRQACYSLSGNKIAPGNIKEWEESGELPVPRPTSGFPGVIG